MSKVKIPQVSYEPYKVEGSQADNRLSGAFALIFEEVFRVRERQKDVREAQLGYKVENPINKQQ